MFTTHEWFGLIPSLLIGLVGWLYRIFLLDRFQNFCRFRRAEVFALGLILLGSCAGWVGELSIQHSDMLDIQIVSGLYRTVVNWISFVLIVNEELRVSRQQIISLGFAFVMQFLWEALHRIVLTPSSIGVECK